MRTNFSGLMKIIIPIYIFLFFSFLSYSQPFGFEKHEMLGQVQYTTHDGIAQMQINSIFQGGRDYMWIGTREGISRFNGQIFETFRTADGLPHSVVTDITEDIEGNIWIATRGGIAKFDGSEIIAFPFNSGYSNLIQADNFGRIWIANIEDDSLFVYKKGIIENVTINYPMLC